MKLPRPPSTISNDFHGDGGVWCATGVFIDLTSLPMVSAMFGKLCTVLQQRYYKASTHLLKKEIEDFFGICLVAFSHPVGPVDAGLSVTCFLMIRNC